MKEVVALQHLVAEFREGDALLGVQTTRDRVLGQHGAESEVLADVAQEVDDGHLRGPVVIGDETHRIVAVGFQNAADLPLEPFGPAGDDVLRVEGALARLAGVANQTGRAADQGDRMMPGGLKVTHVDQLHEIADMQRRRGRVEAAIIGDRLPVQRFGELFPVGGLGNQPAPFQFFKDGIESGLFEIGDVSHGYWYSLSNSGHCASISLAEHIDSMRQDGCPRNVGECSPVRRLNPAVSDGTGFRESGAAAPAHRCCVRCAVSGTRRSFDAADG